MNCMLDYFAKVHNITGNFGTDAISMSKNKYYVNLVK